MSKLLLPIVVASTLPLAAPAILAQTTANERNCPSSHKQAEAIPPYVGTGSAPFSPNQSLCLPQLAPTPTGLSPLAFIVQGVEPSDRVDPQGTAYVASIRGVPGGVDLWRWSKNLDGAPNSNQTLPFKYEGQPDNCGIFSFTNGGCANNVGTTTNLGLAPGGGDADIAVNGPGPITHIPNLPLTSLLLAPGVTGTHSTDRGDNFSPPNVLAALIGGDDRQWNDAIDATTGYLSYHDIATFNIDVQRSIHGGARNNNVCHALAVDQSGFLYSVWSDNRNIFFTSSSDHGKTWTPARVVNQGATVGKANVFPWVAADANGHVVVAWLGADKVGDSNDRSVMEPGHDPSQNGPCTDGTTTCMTKWAKWNVNVLQTVNGHAAKPTLTQ